MESSSNKKYSFRANLGFLKSKIMYEWNFLKFNKKKKLYKNFVASGDLCFDIGAHLGDRSQVWLNMGARVIAFDPQPRFYNYLNKKFKNNKNIVVKNVALSSQLGETTMYVSNAHPTVSSLSSKQWRENLIRASSQKVVYDEEIKIKTETLDRMIDQYGQPRFIKIDVEGHEYEVISGLSSAVDALSFEFLNFEYDVVIKSLEHLSNIGYKSFNWSSRESLRFYMDSWGSKEDLLNSINSKSGDLVSGDIYARV